MSFEALLVNISLALTILVNSHNLQGNMGTCKTYSLIKRNFFWKGMHKDNDNLSKIAMFVGNIFSKNIHTVTYI